MAEIIQINDMTKEEERHGTPYFPFCVFSQRDTDGQFFAPYHWHDEIEFISVTQGSIEMKTAEGTQLLNAGQIYFVKPGMLHGLLGHSKVSHHYAVIFGMDFLNFAQYDLCQKDFLEPVFSGKYDFPDANDLSAENRKKIADLIEHAALLFTGMETQGSDFTPAAPLSIKICLLQILEILHQEHAFVKKSAHDRDNTSQDVLQMKAVFSYIEEHFSERLTLEALASVVHMNKNYFCKFFKAKTGKTPFSYLNEYRINRAAKLLLNSDASITEAALETGFENMSYFIRQFKKCRGCTPSAFRDMRKKRGY